MGAVDAHVHVFPSEREGLVAQGGAALVGYDGVREELASVLARGRVSRALAVLALPVELSRQARRSRFPAAVSGEEHRRLEAELEDRLMEKAFGQNAWLCEVAAAPGTIEPVPGADPTIPTERMLADLDDKVGRFSVRAIKIHPGLNFVLPDHPGYKPIYEFAQQRNLVVISHGGASLASSYRSDTPHCAPGNFAPVLAAFGRLKLVVAHLAYPLHQRAGRAVSDVPEPLHRPFLCRRDWRTRRDRVTRPGPRLRRRARPFGSDFPFSDPERSLDHLSEAGLSSSEFEMITRGNAENLFHLDSEVA
jgi:predicted TIM-barrel fold metal-dependent hydrolase